MYLRSCALLVAALGLGTPGCGPAPIHRACTGDKSASAAVSSAALMQLDVYDATAHCAANMLLPGAGAPTAMHRFLQGQPIVFDVAPGMHALVLTSYADAAGTMPLGIGCTEALVSAGSQICFDVTVAELPDAAMPLDAAMPSDAAMSPDAAIPVLLATDTFHRPDQTYWGVASDGQTWGGDVNAQTVFSIASNLGTFSNSNSTSYRGMLGPKVKDADVTATAMATMFSGTSINFGVMVRVVDANNFYKAYIDGSTFFIQKTVGGIKTDIATMPFSATAGTAYTVRAHAMGGTVSAKVWDASQSEPSAWMLSVADASLTNGQCGVRALAPSPAVIQYQSFVAYSY